MQGLLVTDVDGTLTDEVGRLVSSVLAVIRYLEKCGVSVVLASGANLPVLLSLRQYLGCSGPVIAENGGVVWFRGQAIVFAERSDLEPLYREILTELHRYVVPSKLNYSRISDYVLRLRRREDLELVLRTCERLAERYPYAEVVAVGTTLHVKYRSVSKGRALKLVLSQLLVPPSRVVAGGDSVTDISLVEVAGYSFAPANAVPELKARVTYVAQRPGGEGFVEAVRYFVEEEDVWGLTSHTRGRTHGCPVPWHTVTETPR